MKHLHFPTLLMHLILPALAAVTINHYHDGFLLCALIVLTAHALWSARSARNLLPAHLLGTVLQLALFSLDVIEVHSGAFGLGGGEFALFFYQIALALSCIFETVIWLIRLPGTKSRS